MLVTVQQVPAELLCEVGPLPGKGAGHGVTVVPQPGPAQLQHRLSEPPHHRQPLLTTDSRVKVAAWHKINVEVVKKRSCT